MSDVKEIIKDRLSSKTIGERWKKVRDVAGIVYVVGSLIVTPLFPVALPAVVVQTVSWITLASGVIAGRAQLDTSNKNKNK